MRFWKIAVMRHAGRNVVAGNRVLTRLFYDVMGQFYEFLYHRLIQGYRDSAHELMQEVVSEGDTVLDVGCGTGLLTYLAAERARLVVGLDLSDGMMRNGCGRRLELNSIRFVQADAMHMPFDCQFDCCVSAFMLVMLPRPRRQKVLQEIASRLKPGGRVALLSSRSQFGQQWYSDREWTEALEELGLVEIDIQSVGDVFLTVTASKPLTSALKPTHVEINSKIDSCLVNR